jgi:hypothetical protein
MLLCLRQVPPPQCSTHGMANLQQGARDARGMSSEQRDILSPQKLELSSRLRYRIQAGYHSASGRSVPDAATLGGVNVGACGRTQGSVGGRSDRKNPGDIGSSVGAYSGKPGTRPEVDGASGSAVAGRTRARNLPVAWLRAATGRPLGARDARIAIKHARVRSSTRACDRGLNVRLAAH